MLECCIFAIHVVRGRVLLWKSLAPEGSVKENWWQNHYEGFFLFTPEIRIVLNVVRELSDFALLYDGWGGMRWGEWRGEVLGWRWSSITNQAPDDQFDGFPITIARPPSAHAQSINQLYRQLRCHISHGPRSSYHFVFLHSNKHDSPTTLQMSPAGQFQVRAEFQNLRCACAITFLVGM